MSSAPRLSTLQILRRRRRPLLAILLGATLIGFIALLGQCLMVESGRSPHLVDTAMGADAGAMPCATCSARTDTRLFDDIAVVPATPTPGAALGLLFVSVLFTLSILRRIPIPPGPLLPKQPRTLKFYALRI